MHYGNYRRGKRDRSRRSVPLIILAVSALVAVLGIVIFLTISRVSEPAKSTLVVGTSTGFPPFEMRFGEEVRGLDIDLCRKIGEALGRDVVVRDMAFDALLPSLGRGVAGEKPLVDMVCAAVTKISERDEVADFSDTYFTANQAVLTTRDSGMVYSVPGDLANLVVAYQEGTTSEDWFTANVFGKVAIARHEPFTEMLIALQRLGKDLNIIIMDEPVARALIKTRLHLAVAGVIETGEEYGFAVANGDPQGIIPAANKALREMRESGEYDELVKRWFSDDEK